MKDKDHKIIDAAEMRSKILQAKPYIDAHNKEKAEETAAKITEKLEKLWLDSGVSEYKGTLSDVMDICHPSTMSQTMCILVNRALQNAGYWCEVYNNAVDGCTYINISLGLELDEEDKS